MRLGRAAEDRREAIAEPPAVVEVIEPRRELDFELPMEEVEGAPEDPLEYGDCALRLSVVDELTGAPLATFAWLVRLDAPGNADWGRGDQVQAKLEIPKGGVLIPELPSGLYRVASWQQPAGLADPAAFLVQGPLTNVELAIPTHNPMAVQLVVSDEFGPSAATLYLLSAEPPTGGPLTPRVDWLRWREPLGDTLFFESFTGDPDMFNGEWQGEPLEARAGVFNLGEVEAPTRGESGELIFTLARPGHSRIVVRARWEDASKRTWSAVQFPLATLAESLWLEDGSRPEAGRLKIDAVCEAVPPDLEPHLEVRVTYANYKPLEFHWTPSDGPLVDRFLSQLEAVRDSSASKKRSR